MSVACHQLRGGWPKQTMGFFRRTLAKGQLQDAITKYREAARLKSNFAGAHYNLGLALENTGKSVAFLTRLRLVRGKEHIEILPIFWSDNYISLLPGEKREASVHVRKSDLRGGEPELLVDGWNLEQKAIHGASR